MTRDPSQLPNDIDALKATLLQVEAELALVRAQASDDAALIAHQKLVIEKLKRELYGPSSERTARILDQMEIKFEELESAATEDEIAAERAAAKTTNGHRLPAQAPGTQAIPRASAAGACGRARANGLRLLWRQAVAQAR
jgi:transposase